MFSMKTATAITTMVALLSLHTSSSRAQASEFTGAWQGTSGSVQLFIDGEDQGTAPCERFDFQWNQTPTELMLIKGYWHCGYQLVYDVTDRAFEIRGDEIWLWGEAAGTLRNGLIEISSPRSVMSFQLLDPKAIQFTSTWTDGFSKFIVRGTLTHVEQN